MKSTFPLFFQTFSISFSKRFPSFIGGFTIYTHLSGHFSHSPDLTPWSTSSTRCARPWPSPLQRPCSTLQPRRCKGSEDGCERMASARASRSPAWRVFECVSPDGYSSNQKKKSWLVKISIQAFCGWMSLEWQIQPETISVSFWVDWVPTSLM